MILQVDPRHLADLTSKSEVWSLECFQDCVAHQSGNNCSVAGANE